MGRVFGVVLLLSMACTSPERIDAGPMAPSWQQRVLAADSLDIGWSGVQGEAPRRTVTGAELAKVKRFFSKPLIDAQLKCLVHIDASIRLEGSAEVYLCFGCGTVVVDRKEWNRVEPDQMRALFTELLGPRPPEAEPPPY
ncbi:MAG: hypothetical protein QM817_35285 [Archangium sp.]